MREAQARRAADTRRREPQPPQSGIVAPHNWILYLDKISVSFDGFRALNDLNLYIERGELRCMIGPNGAGKTTMMDVITGKTRPDEGEAFFGRHIDLLAHDEPEIASWHRPQVPEADGVREAHRAREPRARGLRDKRVWSALVEATTPEQRDRIDAALRTIGLVEHAQRPAGALSHGQKQWLEIGMLLMQNPQVLLVDEPVAGMTQQETERRPSS